MDATQYAIGKVPKTLYSIIFTTCCKIQGAYFAESYFHSHYKYMEDCYQLGVFPSGLSLKLQIITVKVMALTPSSLYERSPDILKIFRSISVVAK